MKSKKGKNNMWKKTPEYKKLTDFQKLLVDIVAQEGPMTEDQLTQRFTEIVGDKFLREDMERKMMDIITKEGPMTEDQLIQRYMEVAGFISNETHGLNPEPTEKSSRLAAEVFVSKRTREQSPIDAISAMHKSLQEVYNQNLLTIDVSNGTVSLNPETFSASEDTESFSAEHIINMLISNKDHIKSEFKVSKLYHHPEFGLLAKIDNPEGIEWILFASYVQKNVHPGLRIQVLGGTDAIKEKSAIAESKPIWE